MLTFSGGGTRAAALAYGVLEALAAIDIAWQGRRLFDEVDSISAASPAKRLRQAPALKPAKAFMLAGEERPQARLVVTQQSPRYGDLYGDQFGVLPDDLYDRLFNFHW